MGDELVADSCCIINDVCFGPEDYDDLPGACVLSDGEFISKSCNQVPACIQGCCVFQVGNQWNSDLVNKDVCINNYDNYYFLDEISTIVECEAYVTETDFEIGFRIVDGNDNLLSINVGSSEILSLVDNEKCTFSEASGTGGAYNYVPNCDGVDRLGFGSYLLTIVANNEQFTKTINVFEDDIFNIIVEDTDDEVITISGTLYESELMPDGTVRDTEIVVVGAIISISGLDRQATSDSLGRFELEIPKGHPGAVTIYKEGFNYWYDRPNTENDVEYLDIYLFKSVGTALGEFCCPVAIACRSGDIGSACNTGTRSGPGFYCTYEGGDPLSACALPASYCCSHHLLCPDGNFESSGTCANGVGCGSACISHRTCEDGQIDSVCFCENTYYDSGYCCEIGNKKIYSNSPCSSSGINGIVIGKGRFDQSYVPKSGVSIVFNDNKNNYVVNTNSNGEFSIGLLDETYTVNAFHTDFVTPRNSKRIRMTNGNLNILNSYYKGSSSEYDDVDLVSDVIDQELSFDNGDYNLIFVLNLDVPHCDFENPDTIRLNDFSVLPQLGKKELLLSWDIEDCLELRGFRILRREVLRENNVINNELSRNEFYEIAFVSPSRRTYHDVDVEWSQFSRIYNGVPILRKMENNELVIETLQDYGDIVKNWTYEYKIQPVFSMVEGVESSPKKVTMGDVVCEGRTQITKELCAYDNERALLSYSRDTTRIVNELRHLNYNAILQGLRSLRVQCTDENLIKWTSYNPQRRDCYDERKQFLQSGINIYTTPTCYGADASGQTSCRERDMCGVLDFSTTGPGPFNMIDTESRCYGNTGGRLCVFQPYKSISDKCMYCDEIKSCADYTSSSACERDQCMIGRYSQSSGKSCTWIETAFSESMGEGVCVPSIIPPYENYCHYASRANLPFSTNAGWDDELCRSLGDCYTTTRGGCASCDNITTCSHYFDAEECTGPLGNQSNITINYPKPEDYNWIGNEYSCGLIESNSSNVVDQFYTRSNDGCGLGVCRWNNDGCFRDANSNFVIDNDELFVWFWEIDYRPPVINMLTSNPLFSDNDGRRIIDLYSHKMLLQEDIDFADNRFGFRYCISQDDNCCPNLPSKGNESRIVDDSIIKSDGRININVINDYVRNKGDGVYYLRYIAQDSYLNIAPLKSIRITIDLTDPEFDILVQEINMNPESDETTLFFRLVSLGTNPDTGIQGSEVIKCDFDLKPLRSSTDSIVVSEIDRTPPRNTYLTSHEISYRVSDGAYLFEAKCFDGAGNSHKETIRVRTNKAERLHVILPPDLSTIPSYDMVEFEVETDIPSSCDVYAYTADEVKGPFYLDSSADNLTHYKEPFMFGTLKEFYDGPIYDEVFEFVCLEQIKTCPNSVEECFSNSDCSTGECKAQVIRQKIFFGVDDKPPITIVNPRGLSGENWNDITGRKNVDYTGQSDGVYFFNNNISIELICEDTDLDSNYQGFNAGCPDEEYTRYCVEFLTGLNDYKSCDPYGPHGKYYTENIRFGHSSVVCYSSRDNHDNSEEIKCEHFFIHRIAPELNLEFSQHHTTKKDGRFYTNHDSVELIAELKGNSIINYKLEMDPAKSREFTLLNFDSLNPDQNRNSPGFSSTTGSGGTTIITGPISLTQTIHGFGPNTFKLQAEDRFGNRNTKVVRLFYDTIPPILRSYRLNGIPSGNDADYGRMINITFRLDDVFWTNELKEVGARLYSEDLSFFSTPFAYPKDGEFLTLTPISHSSSDNDDFELTDEISSYILNLVYGGNPGMDSEGVVDSLAKWKEFEFIVEPDMEQFVFNIGPGTYVLEIYAVDLLDQTMSERIVFNVTDKTEPIIILDHAHPPVMIGPDGRPNERIRLTNRLNQEFKVITPGEPSICYFDLGDRMTQNHIMRPSQDRTEHRIALQDVGFQPAQFFPIPFIISCTKHGDSFAQTDIYTLYFDRRPLRLNVVSDRGVRTPHGTGVLQDHIVHYSLDYQTIFGNSLRPRVSVTESLSKPVLCRYECSSPNSQCPSPGFGVFTDYYRVMQSRVFDFEIRDGSKSYAYGDYIYTITCSDLAGNSGRTRDLAISIRDPSAPQKPMILSSADGALLPRNNAVYYDTNVEFKISTNLLTRCKVNFDQAINDLVLSNNEGSLTHQKFFNFSEALGNSDERAFSFVYQCELSADPTTKLNSQKINFVVRRTAPELSEDFITQVSHLSVDEFLPIFKLDIPDEFIAIQYQINNAQLNNPVLSDNTKTIILPNIEEGDNLFVRGQTSDGRESNIINLTVGQLFELTSSPVNISYVRDGGSNSPSVSIFDDGHRPYFFMDKSYAVMYFKLPDGSDLTSLRAYRNGNPISLDTFANGFLNDPQGSDYYRVDYPVHIGNNEMFFVFNDGGTYRYSHFAALRGTEPPQITSVTPKFLERSSDTTLRISLSKQASCYVVYPSSSDVPMVKYSNEQKLIHNILLEGIKRPFNRFEIVQVSVYCQDSDGVTNEYQHLMQYDTIEPRIIDISSDNSIDEDGKFVVLRDEDVQINVQLDEFGRCMYRSQGDSNWREFSDYFFPHLFPRASIPSSSQVTQYDIRCEDDAGLFSGIRTISVERDATRPIHIHDVSPDGITHDNYPVLEVFTYRPANCRADTVESDDGANLFFRLVSGLFRPSENMQSTIVGNRYKHTLELSSSLNLQLGLIPDKNYMARITCDSVVPGIESGSYDVSFKYIPDLDSRPRIKIEYG